MTLLIWSIHEFTSLEKAAGASSAGLATRIGLIWPPRSTGLPGAASTEKTRLESLKLLYGLFGSTSGIQKRYPRRSAMPAHGNVQSGGQTCLKLPLAVQPLL